MDVLTLCTPLLLVCTAPAPGQHYANHYYSYDVPYMESLLSFVSFDRDVVVVMNM